MAGRGEWPVKNSHIKERNQTTRTTKCDNFSLRTAVTDSALRRRVFSKDMHDIFVHGNKILKGNIQVCL